MNIFPLGKITYTQTQTHTCRSEQIELKPYSIIQISFRNRHNSASYKLCDAFIILSNVNMNAVNYQMIVSIKVDKSYDISK